MIENPKARIEILLDNDEVLGCVYLEEKSEGLYLGMLTVNPEIQAKGLGKQLLSHAEELTKKLNLPAIILQVIKGREELIQFYLRRGFVFTGKTEPFPHDDPRYGLAKMKLEFLEMKKMM
jgi:GNAT superfamily N-acetyltransferase